METCTELFLNNLGSRGWTGSRDLVIPKLLFSNYVIQHLAETWKFHPFFSYFLTTECNEQVHFLFMYRYAICLLLHNVSSLSMLKTCSGLMKYTFAHSFSHIEQAVNT